jgi:hypothetical protein
MTLAEAAAFLHPPVSARQLHQVVAALPQFRPVGTRARLPGSVGGRPVYTYDADQVIELHSALARWLLGPRRARLRRFVANGGSCRVSSLVTTCAQATAMPRSSSVRKIAGPSEALRTARRFPEQGRGGMTFQFSAAGSREDVLAAVRGTDLDDKVGCQVRDMIAGVLEGAADKGAGQPLRYSLNVFGHADPGSIPALSVEMTATYAPNYPIGNTATPAPA